MTTRSTYESSLKTDANNLNFGAGVTGNAVTPSALSSTNITGVQFPSIAALRAALANNAISQSTYVLLANASVMACQCADRAARDLLVGNSDIGY